jgi:signal transduction histidine kinase
VSIGAPAAGFVQRHRQQLFATTPMVFTAVEVRRVKNSELTANDAVVAVSTDHLPIIENIMQVLPDTKQVAVVIGTSPGEKFWRKEIAKEVRPLEGRVSFVWFDNLSFENILKQAAKLPQHSAIFWETISVDAAGVVHEGGEALAKLYAVSNAPIFSHDESYFGGATVGGPMTSVLEVTRQTAAVAVRILGGEKAGDIRVSAIGWAEPKFDWRQLQRWNISESRLPPGSVVLFRPPSAWEQYRWLIVLVASALLLQSGLILGLIYEHRRRRMAEVEVRQRMEELAHINRQATAGELSASIAHELGQPLSAILANAEAAKRLIKSSPPDQGLIDEILTDIKRDDERASGIIRQLRTLLKKKTIELVTIDVNDMVGEALGLLSAQAKTRDISLRSEFAAQLPPLQGNRIELQQVVLNLIMNGMDSISLGTTSGAKQIIATTALKDSAVEISIADTGPGIAPDRLPHIFEPFFTTKEHGMGMGLSIARTIVEAHRGRIRVETGTHGGAVFIVSLPLLEQRGLKTSQTDRGTAQQSTEVH